MEPKKQKFKFHAVNALPQKKYLPEFIRQLCIHLPDLIRNGHWK